MLAPITHLVLALLLLLYPVVKAKRFDQLSGLRIRGCVLYESPYVVPDPRARSGVTGLAIDYLRLLQDDLGFTTALKPCNATSWNDFIATMSECARTQRPSSCADTQIGVAPFTVSDERLKYVTFLQAFDHTSLQVVTLKSLLLPQTSNSLWFIYYPFSLVTWLILLAMLVLHSLGSLLFPPLWTHVYGEHDHGGDDHKLENETDGALDAARGASSSAGAGAGAATQGWGKVMKKVRRATVMFCTSAVQSFATSLGTPAHALREEDTVNESVSVAWVLFGVSSGMLVFTLYQSSLSALTFNSEYSSAFATIEDLRSCQIDIAEVGFMQGGYSERYVEHALLGPSTSRCRATGRWTGIPKRLSSHKEGFDALRRGEIKYFMGPSGSMLVAAQRNCELFVPVGEPFSSSVVAFAVPKSMNRTVVSLLNQGTMALLEENRLENAEITAIRHACEEPKDFQMTLPRLIAAFTIFFGVGTALLFYRLAHLHMKSLSCDQDTSGAIECDGRGTQTMFSFKEDDDEMKKEEAGESSDF